MQRVTTGYLLKRVAKDLLKNMAQRYAVEVDIEVDKD